MVAEFLLDRIMGSVVKTGQLGITYPSGQTRLYGHGNVPVVIEIRTHACVRTLLVDPALAVGEGYMKGDIRLVHGSIYELCVLLFSNVEYYKTTLPSRIMRRFYQISQSLAASNPLARAAQNVRHHYDIDERLYRLFLDHDMQYSCGYFETRSDSLETAQLAKKQHLLAKLNIPKNARVLDIGCGWGGLALSIARMNPTATVLGTTLSASQLEVARSRASEAGLSDRVKFEQKDYRELEGSFDRIVSVGMFEHVGIGDYPVFFRSVERLLMKNGIAVLHTIGRSGSPRPTNPWIRKYIFPGGVLPSLSQVTPAIERANLITADVETLRLHYAETLARWRRRFKANRNSAVEMFSEEFCRMWEFYLASSEASFRFMDHVVYQIQLIKSMNATPVIREYMMSKPAPMAAIRSQPDPDVAAYAEYRRCDDLLGEQGGRKLYLPID